MTAFAREVSVVIVGSGPTGLTVANLLAVYGVDFLVLEKEPAPLNLPRAIVLDDEGARTLQVFGLDKTYVTQTLKGVGSRYYSDAGHCFAETGAGPTTYGFAKRHYIYQPEMEDALRVRLEEQSPGSLHFSAEVCAVNYTDDKALVTVKDARGERHEIAADWVIACDGGRSPTREQLGIEMIGNTYEQDWIVLDTSNDPDSSPFSRFFCSNERPAVSVPAPNGGRRYEFMLLPGETREQVLETGFLAKLLEPFRAHDETNVIRKTVYTFHARIAERFRERRIVLLGDAAHLTPPFAGQGMNAGLRDAHNVAWKLAAILKGGADASIVDSYEAERRRPAWDMIQLAVTMGNVVMPLDKDDLQFRDHLLKALAPFPAVRDYLIQMRFKPKPRHYGGLYLDLDLPRLEASLVGEMIPQPGISRNGSPDILDTELGTGFALIAQDDKGGQALAGLKETEFLGLPLAKLYLPWNGAGEHSDEIRLTDQVNGRPLLTHRDEIMLIRPDRYCAATSAPEALHQMLQDYESLFSVDCRESSSEMVSAALTKGSL